MPDNKLAATQNSTTNNLSKRKFARKINWIHIFWIGVWTTSNAYKLIKILRFGNASYAIFKAVLRKTILCQVRIYCSVYVMHRFFSKLSGICGFGSEP